MYICMLRVYVYMYTCVCACMCICVVVYVCTHTHTHILTDLEIDNGKGEDFYKIEFNSENIFA